MHISLSELSVLIGWAMTILTLTQVAAQATRFSGEFVLTREINERLDANLAAAWQGSREPQHWQNAMIEGELAYSLKKVKLLGSLAAYQTWETHDANLFEVRPSQGVTVEFPNWDFLSLSHRILFEERFQLENDQWTFSPRARYRISSRIPVTSSEGDRTSLFGFLAAEWYNNFNRPLAERFSSSRTSIIGAGLYLSRTSLIEVRYYIDITENVRENLFDVDVHTWQLRWIHNL